MLKDAINEYEKNHKNIEIESIPSGSVKAVRKVTDLEKSCDILISADYKLIVNYMFPKYSNWTIVFCSNELVLTYTNKSKYANIISKDNWYKILLAPGVKFGFSNPDMDPCGYRALSLLYLASKYYNTSQIWNYLVLSYIPNIKTISNSTGNYIFFPANPNYKAGKKLVIRDKSVDLLALLEDGSIDYCFEYKNVAKEHGLNFIELPSKINLKDSPFLKIKVILYTGINSKEKVISISKIRYGLTIPNTCKHYKESIDFLRWLLYGNGKKIIARHGFTIISYEYIGDVPSELKG